ncbi:hypothetical protein AC230_20620 [Streptomyces caatingaensis]|uniref:Uncharacterized protein n=1 Tax=Streptomyces caatingaensis TaxID=1678637 RepID=A0A0K9XCA6_9ACTN|nr:hypothetical protein AC230_20620 [Streptomyces caatingaensis]
MSLQSPPAGHQQSALWFSRRSRKDQGRTLLFHGHLKPVLLRDREPPYVKWEGTIWDSNGVRGGPCGPG